MQRKIRASKDVEKPHLVETDLNLIHLANFFSAQCQKLSFLCAHFENKRLALEALNVKVWIDGDNVTLEGAIPIANSAIVSTIW